MQATSMQKLQYQVFQAGPTVLFTFATVCVSQELGTAQSQAYALETCGNMYGASIFSQSLRNIATEHRFYSQSFEDSAISSV